MIEEGSIESTETDSDSQYCMLLKAGVAQNNGPSDPSFYLDASMNQSIDVNGNEIEIFIRSTRNCQFLIFSKIIRSFACYPIIYRGKKPCS